MCLKIFEQQSRQIIHYMEDVKAINIPENTSSEETLTWN